MAQAVTPLTRDPQLEALKLPEPSTLRLAVIVVQLGGGLTEREAGQENTGGHGSQSGGGEAVRGDR